MDTLALFITQFLWFFVVWSVVVYLVIWPWALRFSINKQLCFWLIPQLFRAFGLGLLVPNLSPGISQAFAIPTASVDFFTAILALLAFIGLTRSWQWSQLLTWICTLVGLSDLLIAFSIAPFIGVPEHLTAQWYIPAFIGPFLIVSHVACLTVLLKARTHSQSLSQMHTTELEQNTTILSNN